MRNRFNRFGSPLLVLAAILGPSLSALELTRAADAPDNSATGTWKWSVDFGGNSIDFSLTLKQDGEKLTGTFSGGFDDSKTEITDGKVKDGVLSFKLDRKFNDQTISSTYTGKVDGDAIKGSSETKFGDQDPMKRDWTPKRVKDDATTQPTTKP
jgi:hypothetical protein